MRVRSDDGDIIADLNSRRADIMRVQDRGDLRVVAATAPLSEMFGYATSLRSLTQGRGTFTLQFDHHGYVERKEER